MSNWRERALEKNKEKKGQNNTNINKTSASSSDWREKALEKSRKEDAKNAVVRNEINRIMSGGHNSYVSDGESKVGAFVKGTANQYAGSAQSAAATASSKAYTPGDRKRPVLKHGRRASTQEMKDYFDDIEESNAEKKESQAQSYETYAPARDAADARIAKGTAQLDYVKEDMGGVGRFLVDAGSQVAMLGADMAIGALTGGSALPALGVRAFGGGASQARAEGADIDQQMLYGATSALLEIGLEKIFSAGKLMRNMYGKGALNFADATASKAATSKLVRGITKTPQGQELIYNLTKWGLGATEEGIEEGLSAILSPFLQRAIYSDELVMPSVEEVLRDFALGAVSGGVFGGAGTIADYRAGIGTAEQIKQNPGFIDMVLNKGMAQNEGTEANAFAQNLQSQQAAGKNILGSQLNELNRMNKSEQLKNDDVLARTVAKETSDISRIKENVSETEKRAIQRVSDKKAEDISIDLSKKVAQNANLSLGFSAENVEIPAISRVMLGTATSADIDVILANPQAKSLLGEEAGTTIPMENSKAREMIGTMVAMNARANGEQILKESKAIIAEDLASTGGTLGAKGKQMFVSAYPQVAEADNEKFTTIFKRFYDGGTYSIPYEKITELVSGMGEDYAAVADKYFTPEMRMSLYEAGMSDSKAQLEANERSIVKREKVADRRRKGAFEDQSTVGNLSKPMRTALEKLADRAGVNIVYVDTLGNANGSYETSKKGAYLNSTIFIAADSTNPLLAVAKHELTHHIKTTAPKQYKELEDFVFGEWYKNDSKAYEEAIEKKIEQYKEAGITLTRDGAKEEILADASEIFFKDESAIDRVIAYSKALGEAILDGIRTVLDSFTAIMDEEGIRLKGYGDFMEELGIVEEAERLWMKALEASMTSDVKTAETVNKKEIKSFEFTKADALKNMKAVTKMSPVASLTGAEFAKGAVDLVTQVTNFFNSLGNSVENPAIGTVQLEKEGAKSSIGHGIGRTKSIAFAAVPDVIKNGMVIDAQRKWKGRSYDTVVIAAPIKIGIDEYYVGAVIKRDIPNGSQTYYLHELEVIKKNSMPSKTVATNNGRTHGGTTAPLISLLHQLNDVNSLTSNDMVTEEGKFSLKDTEDRTLTAGQQEYFKNSKVRDAEGRLKVVFHGTPSGEFFIFDKSKGSAEGDFGSGFYFSDNEADMEANYEGGGPDFETKVDRLAERIADEEDIDYDEAEERAREELFKGANRFEVYLNMENPAVVGRTYLLDSDTFSDEYDIEDFDDEEDYYAEVEQYATDKISELVWEVEKNVDAYSLDGLADVLFEAYYEGGIGIEELKAKINELYLEDEYGNLVGNEVTRQIIESLGYDGIIDPTVASKFKNMGIEEGTTHYIVFKPNQIKYVTNENPTENEDIRYSLKEIETAAQTGYNRNNQTKERDYSTMRNGRIERKRAEGKKLTKDEFRRLYSVHKLNIARKGNTEEHIADIKQNGFKGGSGGVNVLPVGSMDVTRFRGVDSYNFFKEKEAEGVFAPGYAENFKQSLGEEYGQPIFDDVIQKQYGILEGEYAILVPESAVEGEKVVQGFIPFDYEIVQAEKDYQSYYELYEKAYAESNKKYQLKDSAPAETKKVQTLEDKVARLKSEFKRTDLKTPNEDQVKSQASKLIKRYGSSVPGSHTQVVQAMKDIFRVYKTEGANWDDAMRIANDAAMRIVDKIEILHDESWQEYKDLRNYLKNTGIKLSENDKKGIADYEAFRKANFGRLKLTDSGRAIDEVYQNLIEEYPGMFTDDYTNGVDQIRHIVDVLDSMKPWYETYDSAEMGDLVSEIAADIMETAYGLQTRKTFADRKAEEKSAAVQKVIRERDAMLARQRERYEEKLARQKELGKMKLEDFKERQKDRQNRSKAMARLEKSYKWLKERLLTPSDTKHIPEGYQKAIATLLEGFDFETARTDAYGAKNGLSKRVIELRKFKDMCREIMESADADQIEFDPDFMANLDEITDAIDGKRLADLDTATLDKVSRLLKQLQHQISYMNRAFNEDIKETISELGESTINEADSMKRAKEYTGLKQKLDDLLNQKNVTPSDMFELIGGTEKKLYATMRKGFDRHIQNVQQGVKFVQSIADKKKVKQWENDLHTFRLESGEIQLTTTQLMSLYALMQREQAQNHILGSGIMSEPVEVKGDKARMKRKISQEHVMPTLEEVLQMTASLTQEQRDVADKLKDFLSNQCSDWGNETSMKLYGYKKFTEKNYFPIKSSKQFLNENFDLKNAETSLKNMGFTKSLTPGANNPIMIDDIFNVFSQHVSKMSMYNALVPAMTDFQRVYNYKRKNEAKLQTNSVQLALEKAYGKKTTEYITRFMQDLNGAPGAKSDADLETELISRYKKASLGANIRVFLQQPTAIVRAFAVISPKYFSVKPAGKATIEEMQQHCPIAQWKSYGFYNTDVARGMKDIMLGNETIMDKLFMGSYGKADDWAWAQIWKAVKAEVEAENPNLEKGSDEYWQKVNERASEIFDRTQVVDSVFHRSQIMRNKGFGEKLITSFMAEPTKTFNLMRTEIITAQREYASGNKTGAGKRLGRVLSVYALNGLTVSVAAAFADAMRGIGGDDDEDKGTFAQRWFAHSRKNFWENINPLNMLPLIKDIPSMIKGYEIKRMDTIAFEKLISAVTMWQKVIDGSSKYTTAHVTRKTAEAISYVTGVPLANILRDVESASKAVSEVFGNGTAAKFQTAKMTYRITDNTRYIFADLYYDAKAEKDNKLANEIYRWMKSQGITEEYIKGREKTWKKHRDEEK